jgi:hypothetical protein
MVTSRFGVPKKPVTMQDYLERKEIIRRIKKEAGGSMKRR